MESFVIYCCVLMSLNLVLGSEKEARVGSKQYQELER